MMFIARMFVAVAALAILAWLVDPRQVADALRSADGLLAASGVAFGFLVLALNTWKWRALIRMRGMEVPYPALYELNLVSMLYGMLLPGQIAGEAAKVLRLMQYRTERVPLVASVLTDRVTGFLGLLLVGSIGVACTGAPAGVIVALAATTVAALLVCAVLLRPSSVSEAASGDGRLAMLWSAASKVISAFSEYRAHPGGLVWATVLATAYQASITVNALIFGAALNLDLPAVEMLWIVAVVSVAQLLPITIAGIGTREGAFIYLLGAYGVTKPDALALSLLMLFGNLSIASAGALTSLRLPGRQRTSTR